MKGVASRFTQRDGRVRSDETHRLPESQGVDTIRSRLRMLKIHRFDPSGCDFPAPAIAVLPRIRWAGMALTNRERSTGRQRSYARGRYALHDAYRLSGVGAEGALLAPSYHCRTMIDPAVALGAEVALYRLTPELEPDMDGLAEAVASATRPVRALLFTHFFGFARSLDKAARFCQEHGITLIEDCSHVWMPVAARSGMGTTGRYAVSSYYKFVPSDEGALLHANADAPLPQHTRRPPALDELKGSVRILRGARSAAPTGLALDDSKQGAVSNCARRWVESLDAPSIHYRTEDQGRTSLRISSWILRHSDGSHIAQRRRHRYAQWLAAVRELPGCRPLFPTLPEHCVPYMFPLHLESPEAPFARLKRMGMPIWRWDEMAVSDCPTAASYQLGLLHLPCHQSLSDADMAWMTSAVAKVLSPANDGART